MENKIKEIIILAETIQGEINRMCVTKNLSELETMRDYARKNLDKLSIMIYDAKFATKGGSRTDEAEPMIKNFFENPSDIMLIQNWVGNHVKDIKDLTKVKSDDAFYALIMTLINVRYNDDDNKIVDFIIDLFINTIKIHGSACIYCDTDGIRIIKK